MLIFECLKTSSVITVTAIIDFWLSFQDLQAHLLVEHDPLVATYLAVFVDVALCHQLIDLCIVLSHSHPWLVLSGLREQLLER